MHARYSLTISQCTAKNSVSLQHSWLNLGKRQFFVANSFGRKYSVYLFFFYASTARRVFSGLWWTIGRVYLEESLFASKSECGLKWGVRIGKHLHGTCRTPLMLMSIGTRGCSHGYSTSMTVENGEKNRKLQCRPVVIC